MSRTHNALLLALIVPLLAAAGCATGGLTTREAVPASLTNVAVVHDMEHIRFWGDGGPDEYQELLAQRIQAVRKIVKEDPGRIKRVANILTLSGGGADGAFGAGLLVGWSEHGTRPMFDFVTGISTGAMMAPMAFLGAKYDRKLKEAYTTLTTEDVASPQAFAAVIGLADALASTKPLEGLIARFMTEEMLHEIAEEHAKGRLLMIGTTNLDAQRSVIWDIGAIASSGHPDSLSLIRKIILASAAIPGGFPPVGINVTVNGRSYQEMHVDGGVTRQVFLYPPGYSPRAVDRTIGFKIKRRLYIIRNAKVSPEFEATKDNLIPIASRSISTLIKTQGIGDLYKIHMEAKRDGVGYNLAYIPADFSVESKAAFDKDYMNALYRTGYELGRKGYAWHKAPPGIDRRRNW